MIRASANRLGAVQAVVLISSRSSEFPIEKRTRDLPASDGPFRFWKQQARLTAPPSLGIGFEEIHPQSEPAAQFGIVVAYENPLNTGACDRVQNISAIRHLMQDSTEKHGVESGSPIQDCHCVPAQKILRWMKLLCLSNGIMTCINPEIVTPAKVGIRSESTADFNDGAIAYQLTNLDPRLTNDSSLLLQIMDSPS